MAISLFTYMSSNTLICHERPFRHFILQTKRPCSLLETNHCLTPLYLRNFSNVQMEAVLVTQIVPFTHANPSSRMYFGNRIEDSRTYKWQVNKHVHFCSFVTQSKRTPIQDFQEFAKPSRLLQATEANLWSKYLPEDIVSSSELDVHNSYYIVELRTSNDFSSSLKDVNAAILLCLIDENGNALLQRLSSVELLVVEKDMDFEESAHFQRGSVDIVTFKGSKLWKIEAFWIGLESGSWRLDGVQMTVINGPISSTESTENKDDDQFDCLQYKFEANNLLLGEGGISIAELRPLSCTKLSMNSFSTSTSLPRESSAEIPLLDRQKKKEDSMREYADLKFSLLVYDLILVSSGSSILNFSSNEKYAYAFLAGGLGGFFYLLLLQRSVDGLSIPTNNSTDSDNILQTFGRLKRQWLTFALVITVSAAALKYQMGGGTTIALSPTEVFVGVAGFLASKVAVVLAAFRPLQRNQKNE